MSFERLLGSSLCHQLVLVAVPCFPRAFHTTCHALTSPAVSHPFLPCPQIRVEAGEADAEYDGGEEGEGEGEEAEASSKTVAQALEELEGRLQVGAEAGRRGLVVEVGVAWHGWEGAGCSWAGLLTCLQLVSGPASQSAMQEMH